ncbi:iron chelate uptake ABC transporter family permease subunit [Paenibacillus rhizoplanae]
MGAAGVVMQSLLRNDMASPGTLGISSGSGLFVLFFVVFIASAGKKVPSLPCRCWPLSAACWRRD